MSERRLTAEATWLATLCVQARRPHVYIIPRQTPDDNRKRKVHLGHFSSLGGRIVQQLCTGYACPVGKLRSDIPSATRVHCFCSFGKLFWGISVLLVTDKCYNSASGMRVQWEALELYVRTPNAKRVHSGRSVGKFSWGISVLIVTA